MTRPYLLIALACYALVSCLAPPPGKCEGADVSVGGTLLGTLHHRGVTWRVQQRELSATCGGITTWDALGGNRVTLGAHVTRGIALHEMGHVLLGPAHVDDEDAVMTAHLGKATDLTATDLAYCLDVGVCDGHDGAAPSDADPLAWAAARWTGVARPEFRITFSPKEEP